MDDYSKFFKASKIYFKSKAMGFLLKIIGFIEVTNLLYLLANTFDIEFLSFEIPLYSFSVFISTHYIIYNVILLSRNFKSKIILFIISNNLLLLHFVSVFIKDLSMAMNGYFPIIKSLISILGVSFLYSFFDKEISNLEKNVFKEMEKLK